MALSSDDSFRQALASIQAGRLPDAERLLTAVLQLQPNHVGALNVLSIVLMQLGRYAEAETYIKAALKQNSSSDATFYNYGIILKALNRPSEALERFDQALSINAAVAETWNNRGTVLNDVGRYGDAIADFDKAISLQSNYSVAFCNKGKSLAQLKRYDEALAAYDKALSLKPDLAEAWLGIGDAFQDLNRLDEALTAYGNALAINPDLGGARIGHSNILGAHNKAPTLKLNLAEAWLGRGNVFYSIKRYDEALAAYGKALDIKPDFEGAWHSRGNVLSDLKQYDEAIAAYDKALSLKPDLHGAEGSRLLAKMHLCDWRNFDAECEHLISSVMNANVITLPFAFLAIPSSSESQLQCAKLWVANRHPPSHKPLWQGERYAHDRVRVGYVSADFCEHAVASLIAGMIECHDKSRFEVTGISIGPDDSSEIRRRLKSSFEHFVDGNALKDEQIAHLVRLSEIDILVDLMGFTAGSRTEVFAQRPAPIQVNYLGYPGTLGANYMDYVVGDRTVIPDECRRFYSEKAAILPNSYQANDRKRGISDKVITRSDVGLPTKGFVFCCFNNNYKIIPRVFDSWMRIMRLVEGSVLWLLDAKAAVSNLEKEAAARGVNPDRLIFAKKMPASEHLARHKLADLFLDTLPYNAHTTASDALWAGLPVLTYPGETFAARVAASLLNAVRLPELIAATPEIYEQMAIDLATHPEKLATIKRKLDENRLTAPLFDTKLFTKHIEAAFTAMHERHQAGLPPDHIFVRD